MGKCRDRRKLYVFDEVDVFCTGTEKETYSVLVRRDRRDLCLSDEIYVFWADSTR